MSSSQALASLTATYTDSEGEEEGNDNDEEENQGSVSTPTNSLPNSRQSSPAPPAHAHPPKLAKLVSYHDDTVVSDEEAEDDESNGKVETVEMQTEETSSKDEEAAAAAAAAVPEPEPIADDGIQLPPEPQGRCSADLQEKILKLYEKMQSNGLDMNHVIQQRKDFRNPSIYEKLIQFCGINELGTNYPPENYDPLRWGKESFYEELSKVQKGEMEKREKERKAKVEVVSGTRRILNQEEEAKRRKSKWDQPGGNAPTSQTLKPAGLVQPSLTTSATGTKGTVISAFGSLPKKPRI